MSPRQVGADVINELLTEDTAPSSSEEGDWGFCIFRAANQRDKVRSSPGGVERPLTMSCVQHCSNVTYESLARHRASRWLGRNTSR
jgi:hypothetical protein